MPSLIALLLPSGQTVYQSYRDAPEVGATVKCLGDYWLVSDLVENGATGALVARLAPAADELDDVLVDA
jgi:hypothetical protein